MTELQLLGLYTHSFCHSVLRVPAYNKNIVHNFFEKYRDARLNFVNCYLQPVFAGQVGRSHTRSRNDRAPFYISE